MNTLNQALIIFTKSIFLVYDNVVNQYNLNIFKFVIAHHDQQALIEKINTIMRELEEEKNTLERVKREAAARAEQERNNTNQLRDELNRLKTKLDETKLKANEEKMKLDLKIEELWKERESTQREVEELQVQLHMTEDKVDGLQNQLHDTIRKLKDGNKLSSSKFHFSFVVVLCSFLPMYLYQLNLDLF